MMLGFAGEAAMAPELKQTIALKARVSSHSYNDLTTFIDSVKGAYLNLNVA